MPVARTQSIATDPASGNCRPKVTVFHCFNVLSDTDLAGDCGCEVASVGIPCSGMTREVFLLKAFEAGADAVIVLVCPSGECDYVEGNTRAVKRVERVKKTLDQIGIGAQRLNIHNMPRGDIAAARRIVEETVAKLEQYR